jgi:hypothetical protein
MGEGVALARIHGETAKARKASIDPRRNRGRTDVARSSRATSKRKKISYLRNFIMRFWRP